MFPVHPTRAFNPAVRTWPLLLLLKATASSGPFTLNIHHVHDELCTFVGGEISLFHVRVCSVGPAQCSGRVRSTAAVEYLVPECSRMFVTRGA